MSETKPTDAWGQGDAYERYIGRWSRPVAGAFLDWLAQPTGYNWLDVGCGTGALSQAVLDRCAPASVTCVEPSPGFRVAAQARLGERATILEGDAQNIPLADGTVDAVVSGLMLNFVPDPAAALVEMGRVTRLGGVVAGYVWDYAGRMDLIRIFWDGAVALNPAASQYDEGLRFPLCNPESLTAAFAEAGLADVEVQPIAPLAHFVDFDDFWLPFLGATGPAPGYVASLTKAERDALCQEVRRRLPIAADGSISLLIRAWAAKGTATS